MTKDVTIKGWVKTNKVGSTAEFEFTEDRETWDAMTVAEQDNAIFEAAMSVMELGWEEVEV